METSGHRVWVCPMILVGIAYGVIGILFAALADADHVRLWRLAAWVVSAAVFAAHIVYEHDRLDNPPRATALHVAGATALGALALYIAGFAA